MIEQSSKDALAHLPRAVVFVTVVMSGSFRAAALQLGVSPGTISHHIKVLEESMSVRLLERSTRKMSLTSAGQAFYAEMRAALSCWERGVGAAQKFKEAASGCIVIAVPDALMRSITVPAVRKLVRTNPDVTVDLRVSSSESDLVAEGIHVALRAGPLPDSSLGARLLHRGYRSIFGTRALSADWRPKHPADLSSAPWIHFQANPRPTTLTCTDGRKHMLDYRPRISADSPQGAIDLALDGLGFIVLPRIIAVEWLETRGLVPVLPNWAGEYIEFHAVTPSPRPTDRKVQLFIALLKQEFARTQGQVEEELSWETATDPER